MFGALKPQAVRRTPVLYDACVLRGVDGKQAATAAPGAPSTTAKSKAIEISVKRISEEPSHRGHPRLSGCL